MTVSTGSTICTSPANVGIQCSLYPSRSLPVTTAATPGIFSASLASIDLIVACAYGLRTMSSQSCPGRLTSSMYSPLPRMKRGSSLRLTEWPMPPISGLVRSSRSVSVVMTSLSSAGRGRFGRDRLAVDRLSGDDRGGLGGREFSGGLLDRLDDVHVASATTEIAADALPDLGFVGVRVLAEQPRRLHDHPRRAEAALKAVLIPERLLERVERRLAGHPLDGLEFATIRLDGEHRARFRALAIDVDRAGAAVARVASDVSAGQPEVVAQEMD